ncbi:MAG TPA: T9SS type A sorting domain-containing protein [Ignavibacteria bacterium]
MKNLIFTVLFTTIFAVNLMSQTWTQHIAGTATWSLAKDFQGNIYAGTTTKAIYKSTDGGDNWTAVFSGGTANILYLACDSLNNIYGAYVSGGLVKSTNGGANWITIPSSVFNNKSVQSVACGKNGYVYVGATNGGIFRSTDYGVTFPDTALTTLSVVSLTVDRYNSNIIYCGASSTLLTNTGFYRSTDAGYTFSTSLNPYNIWAILEKMNGNLYTVTTTTGYPVSKSTNGGLNWTNVSSLPGAMRGACLDLSENICASGNGGVYKSTDDGLSFVNFNFTISSNQSLCYQNKILVGANGTSNGGVWIYMDSTISNITSTGEIPDKYSLFQNFPNPFNPKTVISFQLPVDGLITLKVYDMLGREVSTLVNEVKKAGYYTVDFNASQFSSGVYFYRLVTDGLSVTKKMILMK